MSGSPPPPPGGSRTAHGPGVRLLAERADRAPEVLLRDPAALATALAALVRDSARLAERRASPDVSTARAAEAEALQLRERLSGASPPPGRRFGSAVAQALRDATERVRPATPPPEPE